MNTLCRRCPVLFCLFSLVVAPLVEGGEREKVILPRGWRPDLSAAGEWLEKDLAETQAQQGMNQLTRCLADLKDAELLTIYVCLYETLKPREQQALLQEQTKWLSNRSKAAENAVESKGGSLAPTEANLAELKFTEKRIAELKKRLASTVNRETR
jgi:uncharacterized protein YecT (DUF1311 family)